MNKNLIFIFLIFLFVIGCKHKTRVQSQNLKTNRGVTYFKGVPFSGISYENFDDSFKKKLTHYSNGKKNGKSTSWYPSQKIKEIHTYQSGNKTGIQAGYWPNGTFRFKKIYNSNGLLAGEQRQWHSNNVLARLSNYIQGKENGLQMGWRYSGDLKYNYQIINNKRYGYMGSKICVPIAN